MEDKAPKTKKRVFSNKYGVFSSISGIVGTLGSICFSVLTFMGTVLSIDVFLFGDTHAKPLKNVLAKFQIKFDTKFSILFPLLFLFCSLFLTYLCFQVSKKEHSLFYRRVKYIFTPKKHYFLELRDSHYEYTDRYEMDHQKEFIVYSQINGFKDFRDRYFYSGKTPCNLHPTERNQIVSPEVVKGSPWSWYRITANTPLQRGERRKFGMKMDHIVDTNKTAQTFFSTGIYEPTKKLVLTVKFPYKEHTKPVPELCRFRVYPFYDEHAEFLSFELELKTETIKKGEKEEHVYVLRQEVDYPVFHAKYEIDWYFEDEINH